MDFQLNILNKLFNLNVYTSLNGMCNSRYILTQYRYVTKYTNYVFQYVTQDII